MKKIEKFHDNNNLHKFIYILQKKKKKKKK